MLRSFIRSTVTVVHVQVFLDAAEIKVAKNDMTQFFDSRGYLYELPAYVLSDPRDLK